MPTVAYGLRPGAYLDCDVDFIATKPSTQRQHKYGLVIIIIINSNQNNVHRLVSNLFRLQICSDHVSLVFFGERYCSIRFVQSLYYTLSNPVI